MAEGIELGEFHWRDGWKFKLTPEGDIRIRKTDGLHLTLVIDAASWESIVGHLDQARVTQEREHGEAAEAMRKAEEAAAPPRPPVVPGVTEETG